MTPSRKHRSVALWITVVVVAIVVGYPSSFGPACWLVNEGRADLGTASRSCE